MPALAQSSFSNQEIANGFYRTVFGLEYQNSGRGARVVKKFVGPVNVYIDQRARIDRRRRVGPLCPDKPRSVRGLDIRVVDSPLQANFTVYRG